MTDHTHTMEYAGLVNPRAVWRCVDAECEFTYSRQLTSEELEDVKESHRKPEVDFPAAWGRAMEQ